MTPRGTASTSSSSLDPGSPVRRGLFLVSNSEEEDEDGDVFPEAADAAKVSTPKRGTCPHCRMPRPLFPSHHRHVHQAVQMNLKSRALLSIGLHRRALGTQARCLTPRRRQLQPCRMRRCICLTGLSGCLATLLKRSSPTSRDGSLQTVLGLEL